jgi:uncharacterized tellurite resistance protein B-like protein
MSDSSKTREQELVLELLCCVMLADRDPSEAENSRIQEVLRTDGCEWTSEEFETRTQQLYERIRAQGFWPTLDQVCEWTRAELDDSQVKRILDDCTQLAEVDGETHEQELKVLRRMEKNLSQLILARVGRPQTKSRSAVPEAPLSLPRIVICIACIAAMAIFGYVLTMAERGLDSKFAKVELGMSNTEVTRLMGPGHEKPSTDGSVIEGGLRVFLPPAKKRTVVVWGDSDPKYQGEYGYIVHFGDGVVVRKTKVRGHRSRGG